MDQPDRTSLSPPGPGSRYGAIVALPPAKTSQIGQSYTTASPQATDPLVSEEGSPR
jgi:hypothetical protein